MACCFRLLAYVDSGVTLSAAIYILSTHSLDIGTMRKQFTYCARSIVHILLTYWVRSMAIEYCGNMQYGCSHSSTIPHSSSRPSCHQSSFGSLCNFTPYPFCPCKEVFEQFCHNNYIREKRKTARQWPKRRLMASRPTWTKLKNVEGWQNHIAYCHNSHAYCALNMYIACAICRPILLAHCSYI